ncbi:9832_t:CDS:1, partial [Scutellospora calospora]
SIAQIHCFYITNIKLKLKFSKENFNKNELENIINEISISLIENNNFFNNESKNKENEDKDEKSLDDIDNR